MNQWMRWRELQDWSKEKEKSVISQDRRRQKTIRPVRKWKQMKFRQRKWGIYSTSGKGILFLFEYFYIIPKLIYFPYMHHRNIWKILVQETGYFIPRGILWFLFYTVLCPCAASRDQQDPVSGIFQRLLWEENVWLCPWTTAAARL